MTDDQDEDWRGIREHFRKLERSKWLAYVAALGAGAYPWLTGIDLSRSEEMIFGAIVLAGLAVFVEVRAMRIEAVREIAYREGVSLRR